MFPKRSLMVNRQTVADVLSTIAAVSFLPFDNDRARLPPAFTSIRSWTTDPIWRVGPRKALLTKPVPACTTAEFSSRPVFWIELPWLSFKWMTALFAYELFWLNPEPTRGPSSFFGSEPRRIALGRLPGLVHRDYHDFATALARAVMRSLPSIRRDNNRLAAVVARFWLGSISAHGLSIPHFCGSGTVGVVALRRGRNFIGIELNPVYVEMARRRISGDCPMFNEEAGSPDPQAPAATRGFRVDELPGRKHVKQTQEEGNQT